MMESPVSVCPVPLEQQPLNEYKDLSESWFYRWGLLDLNPYLKKLTWVWGWSWLISGPVSAASFLPRKHLGEFLLCGSAGATLLLSLVLLRLYLGWWYVRDRLSRSTIFYEESGWYDGQTWVKTPEMWQQDLLIMNYQVQPILQRLHRTFIGLGVMAIAGMILWILL